MSGKEVSWDQVYRIVTWNSLLAGGILLVLFYLGPGLKSLGITAVSANHPVILGVSAVFLGFLIFALDRTVTSILYSLYQKHCPVLATERAVYGTRFSDAAKTYASTSFLFGSLAISFWEELFFRGFGFYLFRDILHYNALFVIMLTSILFGMYHVFSGKIAVVPKTIGGIMLGCMYLLSGNLVFPYLAHVSWNVLIWRLWRERAKNL